jgi:hypothetical protein
MCVSAAKVPEPQRFQASKNPVRRDTNDSIPSTGRRGTILTGGSGIVQDTPTRKKTALGA